MRDFNCYLMLRKYSLNDFSDKCFFLLLGFFLFFFNLSVVEGKV